MPGPRPILMLLETSTFGSIRLHRLIGHGTLRACYTIREHPGVCVKIVRPDLGPLRRLQALAIRRRTNLVEARTYRRLPPEIKPYFNPVLEAEPQFVVTRMPLNPDGTPARSVHAHGRITSDGFWKHVKQIHRSLAHHRLWLFDVLNGRNMLVMERTPGDWRPLIVDYKRIGWKAFPWQVNLLLESERRRKLDRRYRTFLRRYRG